MNIIPLTPSEGSLSVRGLMEYHGRNLLLAVMLSNLAGLAVAAEPVEIAPQDGVLLLRNGQALSGRITQAGDFYYVTLPTGEIRLRTTEVDCLCRTLEEGYRRKQAALEPGEVQGRLDLAEWCLRHELLDRAEAELAATRELEPAHPRITLLIRRLDFARNPEADDLSKGNQKPADQAGPSNEDLDRLVRGLPSGSMETFTATVQPLLLNNCTASGCHGPRSGTKLSLWRIPLERSPGRRLTQRNLHSVLQLITDSDPPASPLLTVPIKPHGKAKTAVFTSRDLPQYQQLVSWVTRVVQPPAQVPAQPATVVQKGTSLLQTMPLEPPADARAKSGQEPIAAPKIVERTQNSKSQTAPSITPAEAARGRLPSGADPFDPNVFNRRYFPEK